MESLIAWLAATPLHEWVAALTILALILSISGKVRATIVSIWFKSRDKIFPTRAMLRKHIREEEASIEKILAQLVPNGSTSLRDAVDRIETKQNDIEAFLTAQLNVHSVAIVRTDSEGKLTYVNRAYQRMFGVSMAEVLGDGWVNVIHPSDRERIFHLWQETVDSKREFNEDIKFQNSAGEMIIGHANVYREVDRHGEVRGWIGVIIIGDQMVLDDRCYDRLRDLLAKENLIENNSSGK